VPSDITSLLKRWSAGDAAAIDDLLPLVYDDLRRLARRNFQRERPDHTLAATALVHEAYLRLAGQQRQTMENRAQFFYMSGEIMRRVLIDHARRHRAAKRGGAAAKVELDEAFMVSEQKQEEWLAVHEALEKFAVIDPARTRIVELRYFAGFTVEEIAELEGRPLTAVKRDWAVARTWLHRALTEAKLGSAALE
jgi:RNA polymerase sigma factor (TIGR02999 family)